MSDFTVVTYKKKKRGKKREHLEFDEQSPEYFNKLKKKSAAARDVIAHSDIYNSIVSLIEKSLNILQQSTVNEIVCYGLGSFSDSNNALYQFGLLLEMKDNLNCEVLVYDPIFKQVEKNILVDSGCNLIEHNEHGKRQVLKTTLFYLPHCPNVLLNNILSVNWGVNLFKCVILSNSISEINNNAPDRPLKESLPFIFKAIPFVTEMPIPNTFKFGDVFNDLSIHIFQQEKLTISNQNSENVIEKLIDSLTIKD